MVNSIISPMLPNQSQAPIARDKAHGAQGAKETAPAGKAEDTLELRDLSPQQVLNQQIMERLGGLNNFLQINGFKPIEELDPADFTPEKVANRILDFIDVALKQAKSKGADEEELAQIREQARAGVEHGYKQAWDMLDGAGILNDKIKEEIGKTYELLQQGLDRMDRGEPLVLAAEDKQQMQLVGQTDERSLSLEIQTRDGDKVSINLQRYSSFSSAQYSSQNEEGSFSLRMDKASAGFSFEYRVEGELDKEEEKALKDLLRGIDGLADDFFSGNTPELLKNGLKNGFDAEQLEGFSLNMSHVQTSYAAKAYQDVGRLSDESTTSKGESQREGIPLGRLLQQLRDMGENAGLSLGNRFENPLDMFKSLLVQRLSLEPGFESVFAGDSEKPVTPQSLTEQLLEAAGLGQTEQE